MLVKTHLIMKNKVNDLDNFTLTMHFQKVKPMVTILARKNHY